MKETMANVEPLYVFTSAISPLRKRLANYSALKFFSRSTSVSPLQPKSENEVFIPADNLDLALESVEKVAKTHSEEDVSMVFDGLSEQVASLGLERTFTFLRNTLQTLSPERTTALFLFNSKAHDQKTVSRLRRMFDGQLTFTKKGLQAVKLPKGE